MRLKRNRLKTYSHRSAISKKDNEGNSYIEYGLPSSFEAEVWPAGGKLQAEMYGQRVNHIQNCRINAGYEVMADEKGRVSYRIGYTTIPVSYTHLDVYKRQGQWSGPVSVRPEL